MTKFPKVSILLPYYHDGATIDRAIGSISLQSFTDFECLLIDNNADAGSQHIALNWCKKDDRFRQLKEETQGISHALNRGLSQATGEYIARMDADDWSFPHRLQAQVDLLDQHSEIGLVAGKAVNVAYISDNHGIERYVNWSNKLLTHNDMFRKRFVEAPIIHPTVMWRKTISDNYGGYAHGDFPEDYELWLRWLERGVRFHKIDQMFIKWYDNPARLTRTDSRYSDLAFFQIKSGYLAKYLEKINRHHPDVLVWGASKISRKRAALLQNFSIRIIGYVDISNKRQLEHPVISHDELPSCNSVFVLVYLKEESMRENTVTFLEARGFREGVSYLLVS